MRQAMFEAEVGDDVFGEDPTLRRLEQEVAALLGKEAGVFVPSGTMGNQMALKVHTQPGDEVLLDVNCHIFNYESGAPGVISGVQLRTLHGTRGLLNPDHVRGALRHGYEWEARSRLLCLENTHNKAGGVVYPLALLQATCAAAREAGLACHLDGARLWNATAATGIPEADYAAPFDTVNVCLSKGLGAPVGSVLTGPADLIQQARRYRKMLGGGMRQGGMLAAAGLYALAHHRPHLAQDHAKAQALAEGLAECPAFDLNPAQVETNIVMFDTVGLDAEPVLHALAAQGLLMVPFGPRTIRATTHRDVSMDDIDRALQICRGLYN